MTVDDRLFALKSAVMALLWPRRRRWHRFLRSMPLVPEALPQPVPPPGPRDFILCGASRTGTTLLASVLFQPPRVVTVMEPWDGMRLPPGELFASLRRELEETGQLRRGKLDVAALRERGRVAWVTEGEVPAEVDVEPGFALGVKWPIYWRLLPYLPTTKFLVTLRHPYEVVASYKRLGSELRLGLNYDLPFNAAMNRDLRAATRDIAVRRVLHYNYVYERVLPFLEHPNVLPVRYERWFMEPDVVRREIGDFLSVELGEGPAQIRQPRHEHGLPEEERALVRQHCPVADALGYSLD